MMPLLLMPSPDEPWPFCFMLPATLRRRREDYFRLLPNLERMIAAVEADVQKRCWTKRDERGLRSALRGLQRHREQMFEDAQRLGFTLPIKEPPAVN
jgi:hypothetical protein